MKKTIPVLLLGLLALQTPMAFAMEEDAVREITEQAVKAWDGRNEQELANLKGSTSLEMWVWQLVEVSDNPNAPGGEQWEWVPTDTIWPFSKMRIKATISPSPKVVGIPGLFFIGAKTRDGAGLLTPNGWAPYEGGLVPYYAAAEKGLPSSYKITLMDGEVPCSMVKPYNANRDDLRENAIDIYAGYGMLTKEGATNVIRMLDAGVKHSPTHLVQTYMTHDVQKNERYWPVLGIRSCGQETGHN